MALELPLVNWQLGTMVAISRRTGNQLMLQYIAMGLCLVVEPHIPSSGSNVLIGYSQQNSSGDLSEQQQLKSKESIIEKVRFVFASKGTLFCELSSTYESLLSLRNAPEWPHIDGDWFTKNLNPASQSWVFDQIPESNNDSYCIFDPEKLRTEQRRIDGVAVQATTSIGAYFFMGTLGETNYYDNPDEAGGRVIAITMGRTCPRLDLARLQQYSKPVLTDGIVETILTSPVHNPGTQLRILTAKRVYFSYPTNEGVVVVLEDEQHGFDYMYFLIRRKEGAWMIVPITTTTWMESIGGGGVVYREHHPEHHFALMDPRLYVLPDLDGDGSDEILITSRTIAELCSIGRSTNDENSGAMLDREFTVREVREIYFGA